MIAYIITFLAILVATILTISITFIRYKNIINLKNVDLKLWKKFLITNKKISYFDIIYLFFEIICLIFGIGFLIIDFFNSKTFNINVILFIVSIAYILFLTFISFIVYKIKLKKEKKKANWDQIEVNQNDLVYFEKYLSKDFYFEENEVVEFYKKEENISFKLLNYIDQNKIDFNEKIKDEKEKFINIITCTFWFNNRLYFGKSYIKVNDTKIYKNDKDFYPFILWYSINFYLNKNWNN
ncbi:hypothetical protein [Mycoplasma sp. 5370]